ncbi:Uncharacterised protein [Burkholderia pseudomallei]|uniref:hypothetical protein n=1 Tax=Burkholderia pseudomallei TaxID=28450 RepID=UPI000F158009|nr:hypothetical protein [Burkholderia pseudomallei]MDY7816330.1 hypothetical protein [Burkholderia pseudomallei]MDY7863009.1 hypothetical protein [Burkholderia pseudomallei]CAJ3083188.1 Uncharacterised protein [Burkholderia pseudomallei]CAJ3814067.1 Uncharacterised protein [Burkholderia pseudomallei]CAJ3818352.1 Uncharacterised protein [Burkholderia pseudomallei]
MSKPKQPRQVMVSESGESVAALVIRRAPLVYEIPALQRVFDFTFLPTVLPSSFADEVAEILAKAFSNGDSRGYAISKLFALQNLVAFVAADDKLRVEVADACRGGALRDGDLLGTAIRRWFASKLSTMYPKQATTLGEWLNSLRSCLRPLFLSGKVAKVTFPRMPANYHAHGGHKPSLVEQQKRDVLCDEIVEELRRLAAGSGVALTPDVAGYVVNLGKSVPTALLASEEAFRSAFQRINAQRLQLIRKVAEDAILHAAALFGEGKAALARADSGIADAIHDALEIYVPHGDSDLKALLPLDNPGVALGNLLRFSVDRCAGKIPLLSEFRKFGAGSYFKAVCRTLGGRRRLQAMLGCDPDGIAGVGLLYLVDSGDNVSSALALGPHCLEPTDEPGVVRVVSYKARSNWQPIVDTFAVVDPAVRLTVPQAIEFVVSMTSQARNAHPAFVDTLLMFRWFDDAPSAAGEEFLANRLRYLLRDAADVHDREMLPGSIRQSFLLDRTLIGDGRTKVAAVLAKHRGKTSSSTRIYTDTWPVRLLYAAKIREFQKILETDIVFNGLNLEEALGMTADEGLQLLETAERTGNGLRCRSHREGHGPTSRSGEDCEDAGVACLDCNAKLLVVDEETIEDAVRTRRSLESQQEFLEANAPGTWERELLPQLAFAVAFLTKLKRTPHAALLRKIERRVFSEK